VAQCEEFADLIKNWKHGTKFTSLIAWLFLYFVV
jgi:hypothetical protein